MVQAVERKVRSRARQLYESRGEIEGQDLQDWFQAESEVLENNIIASLYRRVKTSTPEPLESEVSSEMVAGQPTGCETGA